MPPFAEYDNSSFVNNAALFLTKPATATDVYVTSKVTSFYEKLLDFNLCCSFGQDEISIPNNNDNMTQDDKQTHQVVNEIRQDIWMRKAEEADYRNEAVAERFESSSAKSASILGTCDDDEITVQFSNSSQQEEEKKLVVSMQKPSLFVHGKQSVISWKKCNNNEAINNVWSTKKECWLTKHTKKLYLTKRAKVATSEPGMLSNDRKRPSLMKRIKKSMLMTKIKNNRTTRDDQKETQGVCSWKPICSQLEEI